MGKIYAGKILIRNSYILDWLGYHGGKLHFFGRSEDYLDTVAVIEHPSMPEVGEGELIPLTMQSIMYWNMENDQSILQINPSDHLITKLRRCLQAAKHCWKIYKNLDYLNT